ncbi:FAD-binding oxidoreductase [Tenggerimyces flavus]|uniref:FAD-binding oxidoreductase n=1 Tax=Tenggerimyces flavus TaxID=1708749 RepID=A0ABV7YKX8_9ACTN|nr:FAD-binding oxidoreductase [Tenggerimyces flavus]MBM7784756.1 alkyldihydroxyacetonephosphate synthase [Tenggerimyces flavus]
MNDLAHAGLGPRPFARWAGAEHEITPTPEALAWLNGRLGELTPTSPSAVDDVAVPASELPKPTRDALAAIVGAEHVDSSDETRLAHAGGQSYRDVMRRRLAQDVVVPDAVVRPASHEEVVAVLAVCHQHRIAVVPYGGGTSVVGGVEPVRARCYAVVTLDLARLDALIAFDRVSRTATFGAGVSGPRAEELLAAHGFTLGHVPQSFQRATIGGYAATRSAGQASAGYGRFDDLVVTTRIATPVGDLRLGTGTPNAAGPDLRALFVGSEGAFGVITEVSVRVRPVPAVRWYEMWALPSFSSALNVMRTLVQDGHSPDLFRLSDEPETEVALVLQGRSTARAVRLLSRLRGIRKPVFLLCGWEGGSESVDHRRRLVAPLLKKARGVSLGRKAGESWRRHRFNGPLQRDVLLDLGVLVETLETATTWTKLLDLYDGVRTALVESLTVEGVAPIVMAHVSHVYPTGASLYFTVMGRQEADGISQWGKAKAAASLAIVDVGATITHHHAVGRDHAPYLEAEVGEVGMKLLEATKNLLDPHGILNPGVLVPAPTPIPPPPRRAS